jgi:hypothetical protein
VHQLTGQPDDDSSFFVCWRDVAEDRKVPRGLLSMGEDGNLYEFLEYVADIVMRVVSDEKSSFPADLSI